MPHTSGTDQWHCDLMKAGEEGSDVESRGLFRQGGSLAMSRKQERIPRRSQGPRARGE